MLKTMLHEIKYGKLTPEQGMHMTEQDTCNVKLHVVTDAYNIVLALEKEKMKQPSEKSFICHLSWLAEKLKNNVVNILVWKDTRDITADPHTKGSASRAPLEFNHGISVHLVDAIGSVCLRHCFAASGAKTKGHTREAAQCFGKVGPETRFAHHIPQGELSKLVGCRK